mgnify:CR=1 FL=1
MSDKPFLFEAAPQASVSVHGEAARFPVHRIYCVGRNFSEHAKEMGAEVPARGAPIFFMKLADAVVGKGGEFREDAFCVKSGVWRTVEGKFFSARREAHTEVFFDQLEVPIVVTEQNGSVGAFSEFKFTHSCRECLPWHQIGVNSTRAGNSLTTVST